jgi:hypothetical protein
MKIAGIDVNRNVVIALIENIENKKFTKIIWKL